MKRKDIDPKLGIWLRGNMHTYGGFKCSKCGEQTAYWYLEECPSCKSPMYTKHVGYVR